MIGSTVAHYSILEKLGEGGMGVVYKARDTHLDRLIAIKVLPPERVADPLRKRRFVQEAKAASALNHPNIVTVHDIDTADGVTFIAMEYVKGKTLGRLIHGKGMSLNETLKLAVQIADALAAAHAAGIIHRDIKPGNIMITETGQVKVVDFGLAKLTEIPDPGEDVPTRTLKSATSEEGVVLGTVAYMSPEQAEGKKLDTRSDIFSFGSVLYEMTTGRWAFSGETKASTLAAILHGEPKPASEVVLETPHDLEKVISRCLRKDPSRRFQHMDDVKIALEELKEESDSGKLAPAHPPERKRQRRLVWAGAVAVLLIGIGLVWWVLRRGANESSAVWKETPLTSYPGTETSPTFSPDGNQVAFSWDGPKQDNRDIYVKLIGAEQPLRLTTDSASDGYPAWSPDGRSIAFVRFLPQGKNQILLIPAIGGPERKLTESPYCARLAWSSDGKWLAFDWMDPNGRMPGLYALSVETGERRRLTSSPPGFADFMGAFSPDGRTLAFSRVGNTWSGEVYLLDLTKELIPSGQPKQVTFQRRLPDSPAWTPDGKELIYISRSASSSEIWSLPLSGSRAPRRVAPVRDQAGTFAVSRQGNRLVYERMLTDRDIWRLEINGAGRKVGEQTKLIASTWPDQVPQYSPDGRRILFISGRSGYNEVWACDSDGSNSVQLTSMRAVETGAPRWSPDGTRIVFDANTEGNFDIYVMDAGGGIPRRLTNHPADDAVASFSRDGRWIYFASTRTGRFETWKMPADGGDAVQVTRNGGYCALESQDGKTLYFSKLNSLWRVPIGGGEEQQISAYLCLFFTMADRGIYFASGNSIEFLNFSTGKTTTIATIPLLIEHYPLSVSPDERYLLYTQTSQTGSDLMLVENFR